MKCVVFVVLLTLLSTGCRRAGSKSSSPRGTTNVAQPGGKTVSWAEKGISFTVPEGWRKDEMDDAEEMTWVGPGNAHFRIRVAPYKPEYGNASIEDETDKFYQDHKKHGEEELRYLDISGVRGVHYVRDEGGSDEQYQHQDWKVIIWDAQRMYKGGRQVIFVNVRSPAKTFTKDRDAGYGMLQSIKFSTE